MVIWQLLPRLEVITIRMFRHRMPFIDERHCTFNSHIQFAQVIHGHMHWKVGKYMKDVYVGIEALVIKYNSIN